MCELVFSIQEFLKIVPGIAIFPLSFYLAWRRIGKNISCIIQWKSSRISADRVSNVILTNHKDKPVAIFEIIAVFENHIAFSIEEFKNPMILKPLETLSIKTSPYSSLSLSEGKWEILPSHLQKLDIYLLTSNGEIKCKTKIHPLSLRAVFNEKYIFASKNKKTYNNIVYNEDAVYAITYIFNSKEYISIIDTSGFIGKSERLGCNFVPKEKMRSEELLLAYLKQRTGIDAILAFDLRTCESKVL